MIDRRNISYTEGTPLSPVISGQLIQTAPSLDLEKGTIVSRSPSYDGGGGSGGGGSSADTDKNIWGSAAFGGANPQFFWDMLGQIYATDKERAENILDWVGAAYQEYEKIPYIDKDIFGEGSSKDITDTKDIVTENMDYPTANQPTIINTGFQFPDISGALGNLGKYALVGIGILAAVYLGGKYLQRGKK